MENEKPQYWDGNREALPKKMKVRCTVCKNWIVFSDKYCFHCGAPNQLNPTKDKAKRLKKYEALEWGSFLLSAAAFIYFVILR